MTGSINEIEDIFFSILGLIYRSYGLSLDSDASLPLNIHIVQYLLLHLPLSEQTCLLDNSVCKCALTVVDMSHYTEVSYLTLIH